MKKSWLGPQRILEKKEKYLLPCVYHFYRNPPQFVRGEGCAMYDSEGKEYLDFYSGVSVHALGHCHPEMVATICSQVGALQHTTTIYLNESIVNLAEALANFYPWDGVQRSFFCASASEAVEGACLLASLYTGRSEIIALQNGLHGRTKLGMSLTGLSFWRTDPNPVGGITHVPAPYCYRCPHCRPLKDCNLQCAREVTQAIATATSGKIAAFIAEPIQGNGGVVVPPRGYFEEVYRIVKGAGGLFIVDETQTGFGRTGRKFGIESYGVTPDIVCGGKSLGGGTPIGFFSTTAEIARCYTRPGASTFGGNPVTAEAGIKFLEILERDRLVEAAAVRGEVLGAMLVELQGKFPGAIGDVRGRGLMWGVELVDDERAPNAVLADAVLEAAKDRGLLVGKTGAGRNVLTFMPPLIVGEEQLRRAASLVEGAVGDVI